MTEQITKAQIAKIWASARGLGLDRDVLYLLVPRGSISSMTKAEASDLIEHLSGAGATRARRSPGRKNSTARAKRTTHSPTPSPSGPPTSEQRYFIYFLFGRLGWLEQPGRMRGFLRKFVKVDTVEAIPTRKKASALIEALKAIHNRRQKQCKT
jgi:hypothetical protein